MRLLLISVVLAAVFHDVRSNDDLAEGRQFRHHHEGSFRLCVPDTYISLCRQMISARHHSEIDCVSAPDKIACIDRIIRGEADWMILDPEELYVAYRFLPNNGVVVTSEIRSAQYSTRDYRYAPAVVVRKTSGINSISALHGKRSCHTGFGRNAGWKVPFSHLLTNGELNCTSANVNALERDLIAARDYFNTTCVPGPWVQDEKLDADLKRKYPELCQLCKNPETCSKSDNYAGYDGALRCLTENNGDVAWTKVDAIEEFFLKNKSESTDQYEYLCRDGSNQPITTENPCTWARRPWRTVVMTNHFSSNSTRVQELQEEITTLTKEAQASEEKPEWLTMVLDFYKDTDVLVHRPAVDVKTLTPYAYLKPTNFSETIWHPSCGIIGQALRICVYNQVEFQKCSALKLAAIGQRISPGFSCVLGTCAGHCSWLVSKGDADLIVADPSFADRIETSPRLKVKLTSILRESESAGDSTNTPIGFRYAVALVSDSIADAFNGSGLQPLKGKRSCHGSVNSLAGFNAPLTILRDEKQITGDNCALPAELSKYFSKSCIPGVPEVTKKFTGITSDALCSLCAGDGESSGQPLSPSTLCSDTPNERYYGPSGAIRCLTEKTSDVAFTDHLALLKKLNRVTKDTFDAKLLCRNGTVTELENFRECHWGLIPTAKVLARDGDQDKVLRENIQLSLLRAQQLFKPGGKEARILKLFGIYYGTSNIIFQDSSIGLQYNSQDRVGNVDIERENKLIRDFNYCKVKSESEEVQFRDDNEWKPKEQF